MASTILVCLLAVLALTVDSAVADRKRGDHFIITQAQPITISRMDPIVDHDDVSGHVHKVVGGSRFNSVLNSPDEQIGSSCSSAIIGDDMSNYWASQLYYRHPNDTYTPILSSTRIYYFTKSEDVKPFPRGLNMISGLSMRRDLDADESLGIKIACNHGLQSQWLPNGTSHPEGCSAISMGIFFPSCGLANGATSSPDHFSHMAWPVKWLGPNLVKDPNGVTCPESHPIKYPTIFAEFNYYLDEAHPWRNDECTFVLSNGDCTGNNMHADFVEGWVPETINRVISECGFGNGPGEELDQCAPLAASKSESATWDCRLEGKIPDEEVGLFRPLDKLPGCNPLWKAGVDEKPTCESNPKPQYVGPNAYFENLKFRIKVPLAIPEIRDFDDIKKYIPFVGDKGASRLGRWGTEGVDPKKQTVGTWQSIVNSLAPGTPVPQFDQNLALSPGSSGLPSSSPLGKSNLAPPPGLSNSGPGSGNLTALSGGGESGSPGEAEPETTHENGAETAVNNSTETATATSLKAPYQSGAEPTVPPSETGESDYDSDPAPATTAASASVSSSAPSDVAPVPEPTATGPGLDDNQNLVAETQEAQPSTAAVVEPEHAETTSAPVKTCKRKKRGLIPRAAEGLQHHLGRRSRQRSLH